MDLRAYVRALTRQRRIIVAVTLLILFAAACYTLAKPPIYQSSARLFITTGQSDTSDAYQGGLFSVQRVASYADLVTNSRELAQAVIDDLKLDATPEELARKVSTDVVPDTVVLRISAQDSSPERAQAIAQSYSQNLTELVRELETPAGGTVAPIKATIVDAASAPDRAVSPRPARDLSLGLLGGLVLGIGVGLLRELLDTSVATPDELSAAVTAPILGVIAFDPSATSAPLVTELDSHAPRVESFRVLRTNLQFVDVDAEQKVFVITSALPGEGKTTTAVNLAITLAQAGVRTLLIEGDLRRPRAHKALAMDGALGVTTLLVGRISFDEAVQKHPQSDLHVMAAGAVPPNPADLLQSRAMRDLLQEARSRYEVVVVDAPPLLPVTDGALLAAQADGALIVARHGKTTRDQLATANERLTQVDAALVGAVLNMVPERTLKGGYGYGYGYAPDSGKTHSSSWNV